jgi:hypothetical protein
MSNIQPDGYERGGIIMASIFGVDAHDADTFLNRGFVCVNKNNEKEEMVVNTFRSIKAEDIIFIKTFSPQAGLQVKAAGIALSDYPAEIDSEVCIPVEWVWRGKKLIDEFDEKCSRCGDSFYEELNTTVQREIIDLMPRKLQLPKEW